MKAVVLAAGYATRLYPLTIDRPKALLRVGGMLDHVVERLEPMGVDAVIVVTNARFTPQFEGRARTRRRHDRERRHDVERRPAGRDR